MYTQEREVALQEEHEVRVGVGDGLERHDEDEVLHAFGKVEHELNVDLADDEVVLESAVVIEKYAFLPYEEGLEVVGELNLTLVVHLVDVGDEAVLDDLGEQDLDVLLNDLLLLVASVVLDLRIHLHDLAERLQVAADLDDAVVQDLGVGVLQLLLVLLGEQQLRTS